MQYRNSQKSQCSLFSLKPKLTEVKHINAVLVLLQIRIIYDFQELCNEADHRLFNKILESQYHVMEQLLPPTLPQSYDFRKRLHIPDRSQTAILI